MRAFRKLFYTLAPEWLTSGEGEDVLYSLHFMVDLWLERARQGVLARFPEHAPDDALPLISRDRKITRGLNETRARFVARLIKWLDSHRIAGNPFSLLEQIRAYLQADVKVCTVDHTGNWYTIEANGTWSYSPATSTWNWDTASAFNWSRFWVIIYAENLWTSATYANGSVYDSRRAWGLSATPDEIDGLRSIVRQWKPAHAKCEYIIATLDDSLFPVGAQLDGNWGRYSSHTDPRTPARSSLARYIQP